MNEYILQDNHLLLKHKILVEFSIRKSMSMGQFVDVYRKISKSAPENTLQRLKDGMTSGSADVPGVIKSPPSLPGKPVEKKMMLAQKVVNLVTSATKNPTVWAEILNIAAAMMGLEPSDDGEEED